MERRLFLALFGLILVFGFLIRVIPTQGNNFFFTTDQGYDAVYAREIWHRGQVLLKGPETGIPGIFTLPGWFYFISAGYKIFDGHPFGGVFLMILLALGTTALVVWQISKRVSLSAGFLVGAGLGVFWPFYDTSRYAFNPFPLVFLAVLEILLLIRFLEGKRNYFFWAIMPVVFAFNTEVAGAFALLLFYLAVGVWAVLDGRLPWRIFAALAFFVSLVFLSQTGRDFLAVAKHSEGSGIGTFSGVSFRDTFMSFLQILRTSVLPQSLWLSLGLFISVMIVFFRAPQKNKFKRYFITLSLALTLASYFFFSTNRGWRDWHTVFLPTLLFISLILAVLHLRQKKIKMLVLGFILLSQGLLFGGRYAEYLKPSSDRSILANQLSVLDWVYQNSEGDGFNAYIYLADDDHDYPYQYLFWWYGREKYGFVPCEYQNFPYPITSKHTYVPGSLFYNQPTLGCDKFVFLIIEPDKDRNQAKWREQVTKNTVLAQEFQIGEVKIEKRLRQKEF